MKKVINGKMYNTETARDLAEWDNGYGYSDMYYCGQVLYVKRTGEYFLLTDTGSYGGKKLEPLTLAEAKEWTEDRCDGEKYEDIFGEIEESPEATNKQITILMPEDVLDVLKKKKESTGQNVSALIIKALREAGYAKTNKVN